MISVAGQNVGQMARVFAQATIPHRNLNVTRFSRSNGTVKVYIADLYNTGLPFGVIPRLLLIWMTSEATRMKSKKLFFGDSLSQFMRKMDMIPSGGEWGSISRLKDQMNRLFSCSFGCEYIDESLIVRDNIHIARRLSWDPTNPVKITANSYIELSKDFYEEITHKPIPIDLLAIKKLKQSPLAIDIYIWLTYRYYRLNKNQFISWFILQKQFGSSYPNSENGRKSFKRAFKRSMDKVWVAYPQARLEYLRGRILLLPSPTHVP